MAWPGVFLGRAPSPRERRTNFSRPDSHDRTGMTREQGGGGRGGRGRAGGRGGRGRRNDGEEQKKGDDVRKQLDRNG